LRDAGFFLAPCHPAGKGVAKPLMDQANEYKYAIGERVVSVGQYYKGRSGGAWYSVDFGSGELAFLKEDDLRAAD
jgi:hypothetical protein